MKHYDAEFPTPSISGNNCHLLGTLAVVLGKALSFVYTFFFFILPKTLRKGNNISYLQMKNVRLRENVISPKS